MGLEAFVTKPTKKINFSGLGPNKFILRRGPTKMGLNVGFLSGALHFGALLTPLINILNSINKYKLKLENHSSR